MKKFRQQLFNSIKVLNSLGPTIEIVKKLMRVTLILTGVAFYISLALQYFEGGEC